MRKKLAQSWNHDTNYIIRIIVPNKIRIQEILRVRNKCSPTNLESKVTPKAKVKVTVIYF